jgi:hypothetical protein
MYLHHSRVSTHFLHCQVNRKKDHWTFKCIPSLIPPTMLHLHKKSILFSRSPVLPFNLFFWDLWAKQCTDKDTLKTITNTFSKKDSNCDHMG